MTVEFEKKHHLKLQMKGYNPNMFPSLWYFTLLQHILGKENNCETF